MTQRRDNSGESGTSQPHDVDAVDGLIKPPEPTWHMTEEEQAMIDRMRRSGRRLWDQIEQNAAFREAVKSYPGERGYTHSWVIKDQQSAQTEKIIADVQALAAQCDFKMQTPRNKHEDFTLGPDRISLNAEQDGRGTFEYPPNWKRNIEFGLPAGYGECTTDAMPYDALVGAALLTIKYHLGDDVTVRSMGAPQHAAWQAAKALYSRTFPERELPWLDNWPRQAHENG